MKSPLMQFFAYEHLPPHLQLVSKPFGELAASLEAMLPGNAEKTTAIRKLLEAKDCAVRAILFMPDVAETEAPANPKIGETVEEAKSAA